MKKTYICPIIKKMASKTETFLEESLNEQFISNEYDSFFDSNGEPIPGHNLGWGGTGGGSADGNKLNIWDD